MLTLILLFGCARKTVYGGGECSIELGGEVIEGSTDLACEGFGFGRGQLSLTLEIPVEDFQGDAPKLSGLAEGTQSVVQVSASVYQSEDHAESPFTITWDTYGGAEEGAVFSGPGTGLVFEGTLEEGRLVGDLALNETYGGDYAEYQDLPTQVDLAWSFDPDLTDSYYFDNFYYGP